MIAKTSLFWHTRLWQNYISPCILAIIALCAYLPSLKYGFLFDDYPNIVKSITIKTKSLGDLFFCNSRWISMWLNTLYYSIARFNPVIYRLGNLCFHILTGLILFYVLLKLLKNYKQEFVARHAYSISLATGALFLLHPVQTQTVSYIIQGQLEGLAAFFVISIIACFISAIYTTNKYKKILFFCLSFVLGLFSCGTKEIAIVSPALLLLIDWFFIAQGSYSNFKTRMLFHVLFFSFITGMYIYLLKPEFFSKLLGFKHVTYNNVGNTLTNQDVISSYYYAISQFKVILHYMFIFVWPFSISIDYDWQLCSSFWDFTCILPALLLSTIISICLYRLYRNKKDLIAFGLLWFLIVILPRSSVIPSSELVADYKTYLASCSILLVIAYAFVYLAIKINIWLEKQTIFIFYAYRAQLAFFALYILLGWTSYTQNLMWSSGETLWLRAIALASGKARVWNNYAVERLFTLAKKENLPIQELDKLITYLEKAISLDQHYFQALNNLAFIYFKKGQVDQAISLTKKSLEINPLCPETYNNLGSFLYHTQDYLGAKEALEKAVKLRPQYGKALFQLGQIMQAQNNIIQAQTYFKQACTQADHDTIEGFKLYGLTSIAINNFQEAAYAFERALEIAPNTPQFMFELATCYFALKNYAKAVELFTKLSYRADADTSIFYNLAEAYAQMKNYNQAYRAYKKSQEFDPTIPVIYLKVAKCLKKLGKKEEAEIYLTSFIDQNPPAEFRYKAMAYRTKVKNA